MVFLLCLNGAVAIGPRPSAWTRPGPRCQWSVNARTQVSLVNVNRKVLDRGNSQHKDTSTQVSLVNRNIQLHNINAEQLTRSQRTGTDIQVAACVSRISLKSRARSREMDEDGGHLKRKMGKTIEESRVPYDVMYPLHSRQSSIVKEGNF